VPDDDGQGPHLVAGQLKAKVQEMLPGGKQRQDKPEE
jgi:hypothetical protein